MPLASVLEHGLGCLESSRRIHSTPQLLDFIRQQVAVDSREPTQWVFRRGADDEVWCKVRVSVSDVDGPGEVLLSIHDASDGMAAPTICRPASRWTCTSCPTCRRSRW